MNESLSPQGTHDAAPVYTGNKQFVAAEKYFEKSILSENDLAIKLSCPIEVFAREAYEYVPHCRKAFLLKPRDGGFCDIATFVYAGRALGLRREGAVETVPMSEIHDDEEVIDVGDEGENGGRLSGGSSVGTAAPSPHSEVEVWLADRWID